MSFRRPPRGPLWSGGSPSRRRSAGSRKRRGIDEREEGAWQANTDLHSLRRWFIARARDMYTVAEVVGRREGGAWFVDDQPLREQGADVREDGVREGGEAPVRCNLIVSTRILDANQGHAPRTAAEGSGEVTIKTMAAAIERLPRVLVDGRGHAPRGATRNG